jgi:DNA-binding MarR family transcriptional regulator
MMEEGKSKEEVLRGVHPVLPSLALAFKRMVATIERESGVGGMKWFLLTVLGRRDGLSQGEFTQEYEMDPSRVTRTAQSLEADGFIRRERDVEDNRVMRMYLTEEGSEVLDRLPEINAQLRRRVHSVLSEEEFEELRRMLRLLAEAMKS